MDRFRNFNRYILLFDNEVHMEDKGKVSNLQPTKHDKDLVLSIDNKGKIIKLNKKCEKTFGYSDKNILGQSFLDILAPKKYKGQWIEKFNSAKKNRSIDDFKLPISTHNGHELMIYWSSFPVKNKEGEVQNISMVGRFIISWDDSKNPFLPEWEEINKPLKHVDNFDNNLEKLEIENQFLKDENRYLKKNLKKYLGHYSKVNSDDSKALLGKSIYRISDIFGGKKRKEELEALMHDLDEREEYLNNQEKIIIKDKEKIKQQKINFINWRKNLENLEGDIESRKKWLDNKEESLNVVLGKNEDISSDEIDVDNHQVIENISDCAVIIQRGILKQVNNSFVDLIGYSSSDILNKSLFDFIVPEGLDGVEEYYKNRLKGEDISFYETVLLTKENQKINVEISIRPTIYDGDKADIAIVKKI